MRLIKDNDCSMTIKQMQKNTDFQICDKELKRRKEKIEKRKNRRKKQKRITHGIVHAGFRGFRRFVARKKSRCKLIGSRLVIPHDTIPSNVGCNL